MEPLTVAFFGISGSGKGTQAALLEKLLFERDNSRKTVHPDMGALLREFMGTGTAFARYTGEFLKAGRLVPSFLPIFLLTKTLNETFDGSQHVILDGVCRRPDQSRAANDIMRMFGRKKLQAIVLKLSKDSARTRLIARGRFDDATEESLASRFAWYEEQVVPAIEALRESGWAIHEIDGEPDVPAVQRAINVALEL
jgi:adenylate kinase family enzyme